MRTVLLPPQTHARGLNWHGVLGHGSRVYSTPSVTLVSGGHKFMQLSLGVHHTCGVTANHTAFCCELFKQQGLGHTGAVRPPMHSPHCRNL